MEEKKLDRTELNKYFREYYKRNKEKHIVAVKKWQANNPEKFKSYMKSRATPEFKASRKIYLAEWKKKNPDKVKAYAEKKKQKLKEAREFHDQDQSSES